MRPPHKSLQLKMCDPHNSGHSVYIIEWPQEGLKWVLVTSPCVNNQGGWIPRTRGRNLSHLTYNWGSIGIVYLNPFSLKHHIFLHGISTEGRGGEVSNMQSGTELTSPSWFSPSRFPWVSWGCETIESSLGLRKQTQRELTCHSTQHTAPTPANACQGSHKGRSY